MKNIQKETHQTNNSDYLFGQYFILYFIFFKPVKFSSGRVSDTICISFYCYINFSLVQCIDYTIQIFIEKNEILHN